MELAKSEKWSRVSKLLSGSQERMDPHEILGVSAGASDAEVRSAYKRAVLKWHPDSSKHANRAEAERMIREVNSAYERVCERRQLSKAAAAQYAERMGNSSAFSEHRKRTSTGQQRTGFYAGSGGSQHSDFSSQYARYEHASRMNYTRYEEGGGGEGYYARTNARYVSNFKRGFGLFALCSLPVLYFNWKANQMYTYSEKYGAAAALSAKERSRPSSDYSQPRFGKKD